MFLLQVEWKSKYYFFYWNLSNIFHKIIQASNYRNYFEISKSVFISCSSSVNGLIDLSNVLLLNVSYSFFIKNEGEKGGFFYLKGDKENGK